MTNKIVTYTKEHPWTVGAIVVIGAVVFYYLAIRGSSSTSVSVGAGGPSDAEIQAGTALQLAQQQGQQQGQQDAFQLAYLQQQQSGDLTLAGLQASTSTQQQVNAITGQETLQGQQLSTQQAITLAQIQSANEQAAIAANTQIQTQSIATGGAVALAQLETAANVAINQANSQTQQTIAQYQELAVVGTARASSDALIAAAKYKAGSDVAGSAFGFLGTLASSFL